MREMKDSGIEWIGEIPVNWAKTRIGNLFRFSSGDSLTNEEIQDEGLYKVYGANGPRGYYHHTNLAGKHILIGRVGALCGNIHIVDEPVWVTEHALIAEQISPDVCTDFAGRVFESMNLGQYSKASAQPVIASSVVQRLQIPIPPSLEQRRIADYLDRKCSQIDAIIARQQEVIEKLKAYKLSVITEVVTKGLNPDVPMKDSGVEWIGEIPEHWNVAKMKFVASFLNGDRSSKYPSGTDIVDTGVIFVTSNNLGNIVLNTEVDTKYITKEKYKDLGGAKLQIDDIVFCLRGSVGKCSINKTEHEGTIASSLVVIRAEKILADYLIFVLQCPGVTATSTLNAIGIGSLNLSAEDISEIIIPVPSQEDAKQIAVFLEKKIGMIDKLINAKKDCIDNLTSYKESLIYEVVTGKKEV